MPPWHQKRGCKACKACSVEQSSTEQAPQDADDNVLRVTDIIHDDQ